jgi:hypothetical protein
VIATASPETAEDGPVPLSHERSLKPHSLWCEADGEIDPRRKITIIMSSHFYLPIDKNFVTGQNYRFWVHLPISLKEL